MRPFNIKEYNDNPSRKVITRDGRPVRILCTDAKVQYFPIVAIIKIDEDKEFVDIFQQNGQCSIDKQGNKDLFFEEEQKTGWVNIYRIPDTNELKVSIIFETKEEAESYHKDNPNYVATTKIKWKE